MHHPAWERPDWPVPVRPATGSGLRRVLAVVLVVFVGMGPLQGCGLELAAVATIGKAGQQVVDQSKLKSAYPVTADEAYRAAVQAAQVLRLQLTHEQAGKNHLYKIELRDDHNTRLKLRIQQRTPRLTRVVCDFGWFGFEPAGRLYMTTLREFLQQIIDDRPADTPPIAADTIDVPDYQPPTVSPDPYSY